MANNMQDTNKNQTNSFLKGLNKDSDPSFVTEGMWTHARNASNNTREGDLGSISNEIANVACAYAGLTLGTPTSKKYIIGTIYLYSDKWVIFTVAYNATGIGAAIGHEIGLFEEDTCSYRPIVQDACLNFSKYHLITGSSREVEDCSWQVYWADERNNPDRVLNIGDPNTWPTSDFIWNNNNTYINPLGESMQWPGVAWNQDCNTVNSCIICTDLTTLNCDAIRLARLVDTPCVKTSLAVGAGTLRNGSYAACIAYSIQGQKVTDYYSISNQQPIFTDNDNEGSLNIEIKADSTHFSEFILVVIQTVNQGTVAKQIGIYSTKTTLVHLDQIKEDLITVPIREIPIQTPVFEKSDQIIEVNNYLLRVGPQSKFDFNYQPLANLIQTEWVSTEYPANYYVNGGSNTSYLRDEVYAFFIRWVYNTGDKSASYHIPGRVATNYQVPGGISSYEAGPYAGDINILPGDNKLFQVYNTASVTSLATTTLADGGVVIGRGKMGYWESTETYPDDQDNVWNATSQCWTGMTIPSQAYDLCGLNIRHHKFPDNALHPVTNHFSPGGDKIRLMGIDFKNITYPKDNDGYDIPGIVGYEILRGSREGNRSIIAKGMINNYRPYHIKNNPSKKGLYANHPFNTILPVNVAGYDDPYFKIVDDDNDTIHIQQTDIPKDIVSFHSPDTSFRNPYLSVTELKLYGHLQGTATEQFIEPNKHPQAKLIADAALFPMILGGLVEAIISLLGKRTINTPGGAYQDQYGMEIIEGTSVPFTPGWNLATVDAGLYATGSFAFNQALNAYFGGGGSIADIVAGGNILEGIYNTFKGTGNVKEATVLSTELGPGQLLGLVPTLAQAAYYFSEGAATTLRLIYALIPYRQYALQMVAHAYYNLFSAPLGTPAQGSVRKRFNVEDSFYLRDTLQDMSGQPYRINNLKRSHNVTVRTSGGVSRAVDGPRFLLNPGERDDTLVTVGTAINSGSNLDFDGNLANPFLKTATSHYAGLKVQLDNQYGQLNSIKQIPATPCEQKLSDSGISEITTSVFCQREVDGIVQTYQLKKKIISQTPVFFGGDTYINRYTEKNSTFMFYDWLYDQPDGFEFNYKLRQMIPDPRFWLNSIQYEASDLWNNGLQDMFNNISTPGTGATPRRFYQLDNENYNYFTDAEGNYPGFFGVKQSFFYLSTSGVRDFFVESDVIVDFRESGIPEWEKNYDANKYTDLISMFDSNPQNITRGNYFAYDYSLSVSKIFTQYFSQGNLQDRYYDPFVASLCYSYYPDRIIYSLPQQIESTKDSWYIYLANNYKEFKAQISGVKNFAKTGIFITFKNSSPLVIQGVDTLETDAGTKITIGDGGLFNQTPQSIVVADAPYEYGSSQNKFSVISTPAGMFYMSQNQGKIFSYAQGLSEISQEGLKWWFTLFLPYKLLEDFPDYPYQDNPVAGIGCQSIYDNQNSILYFCKKDFKLKPQYIDRVVFDKRKRAFILDGKSKFDIGDPLIFNDASWTVSYDPKSKFWISFHDWHPELVMPSKSTFLTIKNNGIWRHNFICDTYCRYYGIDYPFEVEMPLATGQTVTTLKSMEYILECSKRALNCVDQYQVLDYNFDKAVVFNTEQASGYLNLNPFPKNNVTLSLDYPKLNTANPSFDILFSKEENKYRFNQFWDITRDRGEFPIGDTYPNTLPVIPGTTILPGAHEEQNIWVTEYNGYIKSLNAVNLDYAKPALQRKKFRHYLNFLNLRKDYSGNVNMILKLVNSKNQISPR